MQHNLPRRAQHRLGGINLPWAELAIAALAFAILTQG